MKKRVFSLFLCIILWFTDGIFLQAAGGITNVAETEEESGEEREIPGNPSRPKSSKDEWNGDYVYFGKYQQQALKWKVLKNDGENLLLMTDSGVGCYPYQDVSKLGDFENTWESSTIRQYLNGEFIENTFSQEEKEYLQVNYVRNGYSSTENFDSGSDTEDKVYLLSASELKKESYGFYGATGAAESRKFWYEEAGGKSFEQIYTRTLWGLTNGNPYAYWINENGEFCARGSWFTHPVTWSKHIHPVIKISLDCPYWKGEVQQEKENTEGDTGEDTEGSTSGSGDSGNSSEEWKLQGLNFDLTLPENIPVIGGEKISLDCVKVPIIFSRKGNEYRFTVGAEFKGSKKEKKDDLWDLERGEWNNVKKWHEKQNDKYLDGVGLLKKTVNEKKIVSMPSEVKFPLESKVSVRGYGEGTIEGTIENPVVHKVAGGISIEIKVKTGKEWQTIVYTIPIVIKADLEVGYKNEFEIGLDFDNSSVYVNGDLDLTIPKLRSSVGAGVAYIADVSIYGELENKIKIHSGHEYTNKKSGSFSKISAIIKGQIGVSVKALCFSGEKKIWDGKDGLEYWNSEDGFLPDSKGESQNSGSKSNTGNEAASTEDFFSNVENYEIQRTFYSAPDWYPESGQRNLTESNSEEIIRTEIYDAPEMKIVRTEQGISMMVYVEDIKERADGNHTAVVYSLYNSETDQWSEPKILQDDGTADFYPDIITDGTDIYVAWTNAKRQFNGNETDLQQMAAMCEISVAKYDTSRGIFTSVNTLTANESMDLKPVLGKVENSIGVIWLRNSENDILNFNGTNSVCYSIWNGSSWSEAEEYAAFDDKVITSVAVGTLEQSPYLAFTTDNDKDYCTTNDVNLYVGKPDSTPEILQTDNTVEQGLKFGKVGEKDALIWYGDGGLSYTANLKNDYVLTQGEELSPEYQILSDGADGLILFTATRKDSETEPGTAVFASIGKSGVFSKPVQVTEGECYINGFSGLKDENGYQILYGRESVDMSGESIEKEISLCKKELKNSYQLKLENIEFDEEAVWPGRTLEVHLDLYNCGLNAIKKIQVKALCNDEVIFDASGDKVIDVGCNGTATAKISLPENLISNSRLQIIVQPVPEEGEEVTSSSLETVLGKGELALYAETDSEENDIDLEVVNEGCFTENAVLEVRAGDKEGELLETYPVENLESYERFTWKLKKSEIIQKLPESKTLYFEIKNEKEEIYYSNNTAYCYIGDTEAPPITSPGDIKDPSDEDESSGNHSSGNNSSNDKSDESSVNSGNKTAHKITGKKSYQKVYDKKKGFSLNVSSSTGGKLTYQSSKTSVAKVNNSGYVSIQGIGKSVITVTAKADKNHTESKLKITLVVKPKKPKLYKVTSPSSKKARLRWSKSLKVTGYQIRYSVKKNMKSAKKKTVSGAGRTNRMLNGLKKGKKYYFQVRAYRKSGKTTYYSAWSNKRSVKIK